MDLPRIEIDGRPADVGALTGLALHGYGHFTAMQVRDRRVRGLSAHLARLDAGNRALFGTGLDAGRVRDALRRAVAGTPDASVRVHVYQPGGEGDVSLAVSLRPPGPAPAAPLRLRSVRYQRPAPQTKHSGGFGQEYHRRAAHRDGYNEVLLVDADGMVAEGGITNVGFLRGSAVYWPDAPMLTGITMQLLDRALAERGTPAQRRPVRLDEVATFDGAFVTNSRGLAPVTRFDDRDLPDAAEAYADLAKLYEATPWDEI